MNWPHIITLAIRTIMVPSLLLGTYIGFRDVWRALLLLAPLRGECERLQQDITQQEEL